MSRITLDKESFKALAANTRVEILKLLHQKPHTQAELALSLSIRPASVSEHLKELQKAQLIIQKDEGRKWKYYVLTPKSIAILEPEKQQIWITLAVLLFSFIGSVFSYLKGFFNLNSLKLAEHAQLPKSVYEAKTALPESVNYLLEKSPEIPEAGDYAREAGVSAIQKTELLQEPNYLLYFFITLAVLSLFFLLFLLYKRRKSRIG